MVLSKYATSNAESHHIPMEFYLIFLIMRDIEGVDCSVEALPHLLHIELQWKSNCPIPTPSKNKIMMVKLKEKNSSVWMRLIVTLMIWWKIILIYFLEERFSFLLPSCPWWFWWQVVIRLRWWQTRADLWWWHWWYLVHQELIAFISEAIATEEISCLPSHPAIRNARAGWDGDGRMSKYT